MQTDLEGVPAGIGFESDICVIGAGIAGLILSRRLAGHGFKVNLLEAGGRELEDRSQDIYKSEMRGVFHQGTTEGRFRTYGGASTRWGGQLLSYPDEVFGSRELFGNIGWPISEDDLRPYYAEIFKIMGVNSLPFTDDFLQRFHLRDQVQSPDVRVRLSKFAPFLKRNLAKTIGKESLASDRITVFFHANTLSVDLAADGTRIESATVRNYAGAGFKFKARHFIIATGTIETSRLLLSSRSVQPAGVGNLNDQVGRYFHDHVTVKTLWLGEQAKPIFAKVLAPFYVGNTLHNPKLEASVALQQKLNIPEVMAHFYVHEAESNEFALLRQTLVDLQRGEFSMRKTGRFPALISGAAQMAWSLKVKGRRLVSPQANISMNIETEQRPRADSRIQISDQLNAVGMPGTIVDWKISNDDGEAIRRYAPVIGKFLNGLGMTELDLAMDPQADVSDWVKAGSDILHPMGGARMGASPATSVVDPNLRVHGLANLYIASCATYPTGGSSNPTFSLMALSCRLADLLKQG